MIFGYGELQRSRQHRIPTNIFQVLLTSLGHGMFAKSLVSLVLSRRSTTQRTSSSASTPSTSLSPTAKISNQTSPGPTKIRILRSLASAASRALSIFCPTVLRMVD